MGKNDLSGVVLSRRKHEPKKDFDFADYPGVHCGSLRLQLWGATGQVWSGYADRNTDAHADPNTNANSNPDTNANSDPHAYPDADSDANPHTNANSNPDAPSRPSGSRSYPAAGNKREPESGHPSRSRGVDDLTELDADQSSTRNPAE